LPPSLRFLPADGAAGLAKPSRGKDEVVALSVDMDDSGHAAIVAALAPDWLQLHGKESPERVAAVKKRFGRKVMKAVGVREATDLSASKAYLGSAHRLLLDPKGPQ